MESDMDGGWRIAQSPILKTTHAALSRQACRDVRRCERRTVSLWLTAVCNEVVL
jgi:hypothetical protein